MFRVMRWIFIGKENRNKYGDNDRINSNSNLSYSTITEQAVSCVEKNSYRSFLSEVCANGTI